jgi:hypothetical protein
MMQKRLNWPLLTPMMLQPKLMKRLRCGLRLSRLRLRWWTPRLHL